MKNPKYNHRISEVPTDAIILPKKTWKNVKVEAVHRTASEEVEAQTFNDVAKKNDSDLIQEKRKSIIEADMKRQMMDQQRAMARQMEAREKALLVARAKANEDLDEVKAMNAEVTAARVRTLRDAEIYIKQQKKENEKLEEEAVLREVEEKRLKALQVYEEREKALKEQSKYGASILAAQIEERKNIKNQEKTLREKEIQEMMRASQRITEEDKKLEEEKKRRQQMFLDDCIEANKLSLQRKQLEKIREIEEVQAMLEYQQKQAAAADEYENRIKSQKIAKEKEVAELRKKQQKLFDTQSVKDEIMARRVSEEKERKEREKELALIEKAKRDREEMQRDREQAISIKQKRLLEIAQLEKAEFDRTQAFQSDVKERERRAAEERRRMADQYREELQRDLAEKSEQKRIAPLKNHDEQKHLKETQEDYLFRLEMIRQEKIAMLESEGVPEKYLIDLKRKSFAIH